MDDSVKKKLLSLSFIDARPAPPAPVGPGLEQCWIDGAACPYGRPEGQFLLRPKIFCQPPNKNGGCPKLDECGEEIFEVLNKDTPTTVEDWLLAHKPQRVSDILLKIMEDNGPDNDEKIVLDSVIELLQKTEGADLEVFLAKDLEDE